MSERPPKFICELCGGAHPTSEHKEPETTEKKQEWPRTDYVEDVPEAVAKGEEIFQRYQELEKEEKLEEALAALTEDKFAVAAYLAARAQENSKGLIWVPIEIDAVYEKYKSDHEIVPRQRKGYNRSFHQGWAGPLTPFAPYVQKMYALDRPVHPGKEMANFTGGDRLRELIRDLQWRIRQAKRNR